MTETTTFHPAPPGWHAAVYDHGDPPGWHTSPVVGWMATVTTPTDTWGDPLPDEDPRVYVMPVVFSVGDGAGSTRNYDVLAIFEPGEDHTAPEGIDDLVAAHTRFLRARRTGASAPRTESYRTPAPTTPTRRT